MQNKLTLWTAISLVFGGGMLALSGQWRSPLMWTFLAGMSLLMLYAFSAMTSEGKRWNSP